MLPCEKARCIEFLSTEEIIDELLKRKTFTGAIIRSDNDEFSVSHTNISPKDLTAVFHAAINFIQSLGPPK
jgi:hypothetical protein